ncbi:glycoside hydrolase family 19 protein, partial [Raoultella sp. C349492]|uniref:glycoside hydrolase family 19 protein n=1 Tax=Raoultella sp. C349492 TaxID=2970253 RepID=UPI0035C6D420
MITPEQLRRAAQLTPANAQRWHMPIVSAMAEFGIDTPKRQAAFLAQVCHESTGLTVLSESLYYKDPRRVAQIFITGFDLNSNRVIEPAEIEFAKAYVRNPEKLANRAYANRGGNGPESSGDGWRYRGRGPIQTTFKNNYRATGIALGL